MQNESKKQLVRPGSALKYHTKSAYQEKPSVESSM